MSELRVNTVDASEGTTLTLGSSGNTVALAAGATATGFGSDITKSASEPTATINGTLGDLYLNTTSGEMYSLTDATTNANVWTNVGGGTGAQPYIGMVATGGTITTDGDYKVHVFNSSSTFTITTLGNDAVLEHLVIAGGGGVSGDPPNGAAAGGGGAGGLLDIETNVCGSTQYAITVGGGGAAGATPGAVGATGSNSVFNNKKRAGMPALFLSLYKMPG